MTSALAFTDQQPVQPAENVSVPQVPRHVVQHQGQEHQGMIDGEEREDEDNSCEVNRGVQVELAAWLDPTTPRSQELSLILHQRTQMGGVGSTAGGPGNVVFAHSKQGEVDKSFFLYPEPSYGCSVRYRD